jgi:hypothetical protein
MTSGPERPDAEKGESFRFAGRHGLRFGHPRRSLSGRAMRGASELGESSQRMSLGACARSGCRGCCQARPAHMRGLARGAAREGASDQFWIFDSNQANAQRLEQRQ